MVLKCDKEQNLTTQLCPSMKLQLTDGKALEPVTKVSWKSDSFEEKKDAFIGWSDLYKEEKYGKHKSLGIKADGAGVVAIAVEPPKQELWFREEGPVTALCLPQRLGHLTVCFHAICECIHQVQCCRPTTDLREWTNVLLTNENNFRKLCGRWEGTSAMGYLQLCPLLHSGETFPRWS